jgi:hypothetical protein
MCGALLACLYLIVENAQAYVLAPAGKSGTRDSFQWHIQGISHIKSRRSHKTLADHPHVGDLIGRPIATPEQARQMLKIVGTDARNLLPPMPWEILMDPTQVAIPVRAEGG